MPTLSQKGSVDGVEVSRLENIDHVNTIEQEKEKAKRDSDADSVNSAALGDDIPPGYFYSPRFLGCLLVCTHVLLS